MEISALTSETMSSREIADLTGKEHRSVLRDCDVLNESYEKMTMHKIVQGYYTHPSTGSQQHRQYLLTKIQCFDLMTGYSVELRIKVNRRWAELEAKSQHSLPQTFAQALMLAATQAQQIEQQQKQLEDQKPDVVFAQALKVSESNILVGELAKILNQNRIDIGRDRLFEWLRENGYLIKQKGEQYNQPTQRAMDLALMVIKTTLVMSGNKSFAKPTTKITPKGQHYFVNKFLNALACVPAQ